ncbi:hypothetical protein [Kitasatospora sp. NBC_00070]|uniref:hypothetical protein n=1 Tax=Kitasatospora sp. NBC_00070 TaxID=2975962 RepID=UPI0038601E00
MPSTDGRSRPPTGGWATCRPPYATAPTPGPSSLERTAWIAASGPDITPGITPDVQPGGLRHADVAAHVYAALGIAADPHRTLDGRPFPTRVPQTA